MISIFMIHSPFERYFTTIFDNELNSKSFDGEIDMYSTLNSIQKLVIDSQVLQLLELTESESVSIIII